MSYKCINDVITDSSLIISTDDRGFRFGDGVFELISIFNGVPYLWDYHIERLNLGLDILKINKSKINSLFGKAMELIYLNKINNGLLKIIITRGNGGIGYSPSNDFESTIFLETSPLRKFPSHPIKICISKWEKPSLKSLPTNIKTLQGLNSILAKIEASDNNCFDSLLLNSNKQICEVSSGNIFWYKNKTIYTPSLSCSILPGIMRKRIFDLSPYKIVEGKFYLEDLIESKAVFITNTSWVALPVHSINLDKTIIDFDSKNITKQIVELISKDKENYKLNVKINK